MRGVPGWPPTRNIAEHYRIEKTAVARLLREHGVPLTHQGRSAEQVVQAAELYGTGRSVAQVAAAVNLRVSSVYDALRRSGNRMRRRRGQ